MVDTPVRPTRLSAGVRGGRWLELAAVLTWLVCGLSPLKSLIDENRGGMVGAVFLAAYLLFGAALLVLLYLPDRFLHRPRPALLTLIESVSGLIVIYVGGTYLGGTGATSALIVITAAQAPYILRAHQVWMLVAAQTAVSMLMFVGSAYAAELVSLGLAIGGFQVFAAASSFLALSEAAARARLSEANAELHATRAALAESSRAEERLRISRDLHDALGHHLTALSLQLDVAARVSEGKAADHIRQAHAITRLLLADVRAVVSTLRDTQRVDLAQAVREIAGGGGEPAIHLELPPETGFLDADRAQAIVRCVQEVMTNAARHSGARNLWVRLSLRDGGIALHARDDGGGAAATLEPGHGLTGMRERFAALGGTVEFVPGAGTGFEVRAFMPRP